MTLPKPYFMQNKEWYYFDEEEFMYKLTKDAPDEAKQSYKEFYSQVYGSDVDGRRSSNISRSRS